VRGGGPKDVLQLLIHLVHPIGTGGRQGVQECGHYGHVLASFGEVGALPSS
jgi:hypothetical protein